ncbi:hypothetical protein ACA910_004682 [Epithemia clementina (nom. ined.)]
MLFLSSSSSLLVGAQDPSEMPSEMPSQIEDIQDIATEVPLNGASIQMNVLQLNSEEFARQTAAYLFVEMLAGRMLPDSIDLVDMQVGLVSIIGRRQRQRQRQQRRRGQQEQQQQQVQVLHTARAKQDADEEDAPESVEDVERAVLAEEQELLRRQVQVTSPTPSNSNLELFTMEISISALVTGDVNDRVVRELNNAVEAALVKHQELYQASLQGNANVAKEIYLVQVNMILPAEPTPSPSNHNNNKGGGGGKKDAPTKAPTAKPKPIPSEDHKSGKKDASSTSTKTTTTKAPKTTSPSGGGGGKKSKAEPELHPIGMVAQEEGFKFLVTVLKATGLWELANSNEYEGKPVQITVFAPTDDAFKALGEETLSYLLEENTEDLAAILLYHVIGRPWTVQDIMAQQQTSLTVDTLLEGYPVQLLVNHDIGEIAVKGNGNTEATPVVVGDIMASNGVIHVIEEILLPY